MPTAVFPGSFDPTTLGHDKVVERAAKSFDKVVVALGVNPDKKYMFSLAEREMLARDALAHLPNVSVVPFEGLLIDFLKEHNLGILIRGLRNSKDHEDNLAQDLYGQSQRNGKDIVTWYDQTPPSETFISSTMLKAAIKEQGDATGMARLKTIHAVQARMQGQYLYGVTGMSGVGKSHLCGEFARIAKDRGVELHHVDVDKIVHDILSTRSEPHYVELRKKIGEVFGARVVNPDGSINRKKLGPIVFNDPEKLKTLNEMVYDPVLTRLRKELKPLKDIVLVDYALMAEARITNLVNNHVLLVDADKDMIKQRLLERSGLEPDQAMRRAGSQLTTRTKLAKVKQAIEAAGYGSVQKITNGPKIRQKDIEAAFDEMLEQADLFGEIRKQARQNLAKRETSAIAPAA